MRHSQVMPRRSTDARLNEPSCEAGWLCCFDHPAPADRAPSASCEKWDDGAKESARGGVPCMMLRYESCSGRAHGFQHCNQEAVGARKSAGRRKVRYAVVGLGHIVQAAVLPAFEHAKRNSVLAALVSGDLAKRSELGRRYGVPTYSYEDYDKLLVSGDVDAVYIGLPNHQHCGSTLRAAKAGVHVLCEKPMAVTSAECQQMVRAAERGGIRLMIAYRLHFEAANLEALKIARSGRLGELRLFVSTFSMQVKPDNIRLNPAELGGGPLYDLGVYCLQAARLLFGAEPTEVMACSAGGDRERFKNVDEAISTTLLFPGRKLATFAVSLGAADVSSYRLVGTKGSLHVEPAYDYSIELAHRLKLGERESQRTYPKRDQFAPELLHFSDCVLRGRDPEPSGVEGAIDVEVIQAIQRAASTGKRVALHKFPRERAPSPRQEMRRPAVGKRKLVNAESSSRD
jgi:predicted dehydrogenase